MTHFENIVALIAALLLAWAYVQDAGYVSYMMFSNYLDTFLKGRKTSTIICVCALGLLFVYGLLRVSIDISPIAGEFYFERSNIAEAFVAFTFWTGFLCVLAAIIFKLVESIQPRLYSRLGR